MLNGILILFFQPTAEVIRSKTYPWVAIPQHNPFTDFFSVFINLVQNHLILFPIAINCT